MFLFKKEALFSALLLILGVGLISNQAVAQEKTQSDTKLYGKVIDNSSQEALSDIEVTVKGVDKTATTDQKGMFVVKSLKTGSYTVEVTAKGYQKWEKDVKVNKKGKQLAIKLKPTEG